MRGRPLLECLAFALVWGLLLAPLWRISQRRGGREPVLVPAPSGEEVHTVWVRLRFSEPPLRFALHSEGRAVWEETGPETDMEQPCDVAWSDLGPKLDLEADWVDTGRRAVEIGLTPLDGRRTRATVWTGETRLRESLVFE